MQYTKMTYKDVSAPYIDLVFHRTARMAVARRPRYVDQLHSSIVVRWALPRQYPSTDRERETRAENYLDAVAGPRGGGRQGWLTVYKHKCADGLAARMGDKTALSCM